MKLLNRNRLLVLVYHGIYDGPKIHGTMPDTFVHVSDAAAQLREIKRRHHIIKPEELLHSLESGASLPHHPTLITFDDGYESFYRLAEPVLESLGIRPVVFVSTRYLEEQRPFWFDFVWALVMNCEIERVRSLAASLGLDGSLGERKALAMSALGKLKKMPPDKRDATIQEMADHAEVKSPEYEKLLRLFLPMTKDQIRTLSDRGVTFGGHTHTHTILSVLPQAQAEEEIVINKKRLESITGKPCDLFAYPNGGPGDFEEAHKKILRTQGFSAAFTLTQGRSNPRKDPMAISRLNVAPEDTPESLLFRCTGITPIVDWLRTKLL